jgi:CDP-diacylglycerol pyrophosphatase
MGLAKQWSARMSGSIDGLKRIATRIVPSRRLAAIFMIGWLAWLAAPAPSLAADPNALWTIVHGLCTTDQKAFDQPAPCSDVDLAGGYAVLKDISGATQYLLIPTDRVSGIESPEVLAPRSPNYFEDAWLARDFVERSLGHALPRDDVGLAINSVYGRSQNQLHIHIDCVRADVRAALNAESRRIGRTWSTRPMVLAGHPYRALRLYGSDLAAVDPFRLLAKTDPDARASMARETLVAIGATFAGGKPGFFLLSGRATSFPPDQGSGEDLLDHSCALGREQPKLAGSPTP